MSDLIARVRGAFEYDPETGALVWRVRPLSDFASKNAWAVWNAKHAGTDAGWIDANGYRVIRFNGLCLKRSRVAWMIAYGEVPNTVDHQDGDTLNDRLGNLRNVSPATNSRNRARGVNNKSGRTGVYAGRAGFWSAQINVDGRHKYLGSFPSYAAAVRARETAEATYGYHPNHDRSGTPGGDK